ncbi:ABC transporter ATP-binding protein [soil metagenome]
MVEPLLEARSLLRRYEGRTVVDVESLALRQGEVLAIVGPNGAGKSTLFRLLLLLERPDAGSIRIGGASAVARPADARMRLAGVFQRPILFSGTVRDNVAYGLRVRGVGREESERRVAEALHWFDLETHARSSAHTLSGGELQRVALARALVVQPDVLLLDEPTANLDATLRRRFREDLERVARQHARGVILITHDAVEAVGLADRIAVMQQGRVVQTDTPEQILLRPGTPYVAELTGAELLLHGSVDDVADGLYCVRVADGVQLWATSAESAGLARGTPAVLAYRPEDIVLSAVESDVRTSAINRFLMTVQALAFHGGLVRVLLRPPTGGDTLLTALLTRRSAEHLQLAPGTEVLAHIKAVALHAWRAQPAP